MDENSIQEETIGFDQWNMRNIWNHTMQHYPKIDLNTEHSLQSLFRSIRMFGIYRRNRILRLKHQVLAPPWATCALDSAGPMDVLDEGEHSSDFSKKTNTDGCIIVWFLYSTPGYMNITSNAQQEKTRHLLHSKFRGLPTLTPNLHQGSLFMRKRDFFLFVETDCF